MVASLSKSATDAGEDDERHLPEQRNDFCIRIRTSGVRVAAACIMVHKLLLFCYIHMLVSIVCVIYHGTADYNVNHTKNQYCGGCGRGRQKNCQEYTRKWKTPLNVP